MARLLAGSGEVTSAPSKDTALAILPVRPGVIQRRWPGCNGVSPAQTWGTLPLQLALQA